MEENILCCRCVARGVEVTANTVLDNIDGPIQEFYLCETCTKHLQVKYPDVLWRFTPLSEGDTIFQ